MRLPLRSFALLVLGVVAATCSDAPSVGPHPTTAPGTGLLSFVPVFSKTAAAVLAQRSLFAAVDFDHVRVVLVRPPADTVRDTTIAFTPGSAPQTLELPVQVVNVGEEFDGFIDYTNGGVVVFHGQAKLKSHAPDQPAPPQQEIVLQYVGVGANATSIAVAPKAITLQAPNSATFRATAVDAGGNVVSGVPLSWSSSDPTVATIDANSGVLTTVGKRGTTTVSARTPTGLTDNAVATVTLPPTGITLVSGGGQTGQAGSALAQPGVVRVVASDGVGVPGVSVNFAAPTGGSVSSSTATTNADGQASTTLTLGGTAGPQSFVAATGELSVSIPATATPADPSAIVVFAGSGQQDTVRKTLTQPFVAKVTDRFGNAVPGVTVTWARASGTGTLSGTSSVTNENGTASISYTFGASSGVETVTATAAGVSTSATFTATALSALPANIVVVSGSGQTGRVSQPLGAPFVVRVTDEAGAPVGNVAVSWTATNGTVSPSTTTDAQGESSNTMTVGTGVGAASATASVTTATGSKTATFNVAVQTGVVAQLAFRAPPATASLATAMNPPIQIELRDAGGNLTAAVNAVTIALGANPGEATLRGTLTRNAVGGVATFDDLTLNQLGTGYTLVASSAGVADRTSAPFDVVPLVRGGAYKLAFVTPPPSTATSGIPLQPQPVLQIQDQGGNPVGSEIAFQVTASIDVGSAQGNTTNSDVETGRVTFGELAFTGTGPRTVTFSAEGLQSVSAPINLVQSPPASIALVDGANFQPLPVTPPPSVTMTAGTIPQAPPAVKVADANGNGVAGVSVAFSLSRGPTALISGNATTNAQGIITFQDLVESPSNLQVAGSYVVTATLPNVAGSPITLPVTVTPGPGTALRFGTPFPTGGSANVPLTPAVIVNVIDAYGNLVTTASDSITLSISQGTGTPSAVLGGTYGRSASGGVVTFSDLTINLAGSGYTLTAAAANRTTAISSAFTITANPPAAVAPVAPVLVATTDESLPWPAGSYPSVRVTNASSSPVPNVPVSFTVLGGPCFTPGEAPSVVSTNASGVAALNSNSLTIDRATEGSCSVLATVNGIPTTTVSVVMAPTSAVKVWTGGTSSNWSDPTNWFNASAPSASDSVYTPGWTPHRPALTGPVTITGLRVENGGLSAIDVASSQLTIAGDLVTFAPDAIMASGSGSVAFTKPGPGIIAGVITAPVTVGAQSCGATEYTVTTPGSSGTVGFSTGPLTINCPLVIPRAVVTVTGPMTVQNSGKLIMNDPVSTVSTTGDVVFDGASEAESINYGTFLVGGNMTVGATHTNTAFTAAPVVEQRFRTQGTHTITVSPSALATFGQLTISDVGGTNAISIVGSLNADLISVENGASLSAASPIRTTLAHGFGTGSFAGVARLEVSGPIFPSIAGPAPVLTVLTGQDIHAPGGATLAGSVELQGTLVVDNNISIAGNLAVTGAAGEVVMEGDDVMLSVKGNATFAGKAATRLTNGILEVGGNFVQDSTVSRQSFSAGSGHLTRFNSTTGVKTVHFDNAEADVSGFGRIEVVSGGIDFAGHVIASGSLTTNAQIQFLADSIPTRIEGMMIFLDPSRTTVQAGATVRVFGAQFPDESQNIIVQIFGTMTSQTGCVGGNPGGATFCPMS